MIKNGNDQEKTKAILKLINIEEMIPENHFLRVIEKHMKVYNIIFYTDGL